MTALRDAVYAVAAADSTLLALLGAGSAGLLGSTTTAAPPGATAPWAYLGFDSEAESLAPNAVDGSFRWWVYDDEHQGYGRIDAIAGRLLMLYREQTAALYRDATTQECIYWQAGGTVGPDTIAREYDGLLLRWVVFPYRKSHAGF
jgi:hypothetical protein